MPAERIFCSQCGASILVSTDSSSGGVCLPCYKKNNHDFSPHEIARVRASGLSDFFESWNGFTKTPVPKAEQGTPIELVSGTLPVIYGAVTGFIRSGGTTDLSKPLDMLNRLRAESKGKRFTSFLDTLSSFLRPEEAPPTEKNAAEQSATAPQSKSK